MNFIFLYLFFSFSFVISHSRSFDFWYELQSDRIVCLLYAFLTFLRPRLIDFNYLECRSDRALLLLSHWSHRFSFTPLTSFARVCSGWVHWRTRTSNFFHYSAQSIRIAHKLHFYPMSRDTGRCQLKQFERFNSHCIKLILRKKFFLCDTSFGLIFVYRFFAMKNTRFDRKMFKFKRYYILAKQKAHYCKRKQEEGNRINLRSNYPIGFKALHLHSLRSFNKSQ